MRTNKSKFRSTKYTKNPGLGPSSLWVWWWCLGFRIETDYTQIQTHSTPQNCVKSIHVRLWANHWSNTRLHGSRSRSILLIKILSITFNLTVNQSKRGRSRFQEPIISPLARVLSTLPHQELYLSLGLWGSACLMCFFAGFEQDARRQIGLFEGSQQWRKKKIT